MNDKSFISRWSRLKSERATQEQSSKATPDKPERGLSATDDTAPDASDSVKSSSTPIETSTAFPEEQHSEPENLNSDSDKAITAPPLTDEDMPSIESLGEKSDFSQFLSSGVSDELRNLALRKLFNLPQFNARDGLNDYDDDFSKIPVLAKEVATTLRNWINDQQDQLTSEINDELKEAQDVEAKEELIEEPAETLTDTPPPDTSDLTDTCKRAGSTSQTEQVINTDDDLGDADLQG